jgi:hypothetical protein
MRMAFWAALAIAAAAFLIGCSVDLEKAVVGRYRAEVDISGIAAEHKSQALNAAAGIQGLAVEFRPDKTFSAELGPMRFEGTWKIEERVLVATATTGEFPKLSIEEGGKKLVPVFSESERKGLAGAEIWLKKE